MRLLLRRLGFALGLLMCAAPLSCSTAGPTADGIAAPIFNPPTVTVSVAFADTSTLTLAPSMSQALQVTVTPPAVYQVDFALLGDSLGAMLGQTTISTGADGQGAVMLDAPATSTTFHVQASVLGADGAVEASAERAVAVSEQGFGTVNVSPSYLGDRAITTWTANVVAGVTCASLAGSLPEDPAGAVSATAAYGSNPVVDNLPVGPNLAVELRAGHFAWGCTDATMLASNATLDVTVTVVDKPIDLSAAQLQLTFAYSPDPSSYATFLAGVVSTLDDAFVPPGSNEGAVVLNAMASLTPSSESAAFTQTRQEQGWDMLAQQHFAALPEGLRDTCQDWASAGAAAAPTSIVATAVGNTTAEDVTFTVTQFAGLEPAAAGVTTAPGATWSGQPGNSVLLGATLLWQPSLFAGAVCLAPALAAHPGVTTVSQSLALSADCHGLAKVLGPFGSCAVDCVEQLCNSAIAARWTAALGASGQAATPPRITLQASGDALVGDVAQPVSLTGQWLGQLGDGTLTLSVMGDLTSMPLVTVSPPAP